VVNSENSDPAKNKRADLPAAGKFTRGQKKKIPFLTLYGLLKYRKFWPVHRHRCLVLYPSENRTMICCMYRVLIGVCFVYLCPLRLLRWTEQF
jgi:hypothetical protein